MEASNSQQSSPSEDKNKMDTVAMARQEREKNGPWEVEISYGGEVDLHRHLNSCNKNPGHLNFVPVDLFNVDCLPSDCQDKDLMDMVRVVSDLTVRVSVKYVSKSRPETCPRSGDPYPYYRWRDMMRVGTGWVWGVDINYINDLDGKKTCGCKECLNSPTPKTKFADIHILTATHLVFDDQEAAATTCHLFFDRGVTPDVCDGAIALSGMSRIWSDIDDDWFLMIHSTHDLNLARRLDKMVSHRYNLEGIVNARYTYKDYHSPKETRSEPDPMKKLAIIVSHPHGCSKQVSVGFFTNKDDVVDDYTQYTYTTATCPGSSGAQVCVMGDGMRNFYSSLVHSGGDKELNYSCWRHITSGSRCTQNN